jgi:hypothetical protein
MRKKITTIIIVLISLLLIVFFFFHSTKETNQTDNKGTELEQLVRKDWNYQQYIEKTNNYFSQKNKTGDYQGGYTLRYYTDNEVLILVFDDKLTKKISSIQKLTKVKANEFTKDRIGLTVNDVIKYDPNGNYNKYYASGDNRIKNSSHYTIDRYLIIVSYDDNQKVKNITYYKVEKNELIVTKTFN